ncbi:ABC-type antimicrobial peptide transport system ATPase subunit [Clostridium pascui]|nr:ABC-type antimicrobial peptide transport system ATPase subunit [Clostridium pascui]
MINAKAKVKEHISEGNTISDKSPIAKEITKINKENMKAAGNFFKFSSTNITSI